MIEAMVDFTGGVGRTFDLQVIREIDLFQIIYIYSLYLFMLVRRESLLFGAKR